MSTVATLWMVWCWSQSTSKLAF